MKSPEHEDWISSPSFCSQRGGRGISLYFSLIHNEQAKLANGAHSVEDFPCFVGGLYVQEEELSEEKWMPQKAR